MSSRVKRRRSSPRHPSGLNRPDALDVTCHAPRTGGSRCERDEYGPSPGPRQEPTHAFGAPGGGPRDPADLRWSAFGSRARTRATTAQKEIARCPTRTPRSRAPSARRPPAPTPSAPRPAATPPAGSGSVPPPPPPARLRPAPATRRTTPHPVRSAVPPRPPRLPMQSGADAIDDSSAGFLPALFDFSFTSFVTPKIVRFVYVLATVWAVADVRPHRHPAVHLEHLGRHHRPRLRAGRRASSGSPS